MWRSHLRNLPLRFLPPKPCHLPRAALIDRTCSSDVAENACDMPPSHHAQHALSSLIALRGLGTRHALKRSTSSETLPLGPNRNAQGSPSASINLCVLTSDARSCSWRITSARMPAARSRWTHRKGCKQRFMSFVPDTAPSSGIPAQPNGSGTSKSTNSWCRRPLSFELAASTTVL